MTGQMIEKQYKSLVLPNNDYKNYVRPPIVSIIMRAGDRGSSYSFSGCNLNKYSTIGDLYKYPQYFDIRVDSNGVETSCELNPYIKVTKNLGDGNVYKRFIVTSVKINPLDTYNTSFKTPSDYIVNYPIDLF